MLNQYSSNLLLIDEIKYIQATISNDIKLTINMNYLNLDTEAQELLIGTLRDGIFYLFCYTILFFLFSKFIKNQKIKAIIIGLITPFFFYYSALSFWYPSSLLLSFLKIDPAGLLSGLIFFLITPLSLISGISMTFYLLKKK